MPEAETAGSRSPSRAVQREREGGKVQARLVGTDAHVLGTERLLQRILGHLGQHLGHHLNFAQLLAVDESTSSSRLSSVSGCARVGLFWFRLGSGVLGIWWLVFLCEP